MQRLSITFHSQKESQIERQNSTIKAFLQAFVNFKQNDWVRLLPIAEFAYNNTKNAGINYMLFEFNYRYHPWVFYKKDLNPRF